MLVTRLFFVSCPWAAGFFGFLNTQSPVCLPFGVCVSFLISKYAQFCADFDGLDHHSNYLFWIILFTFFFPSSKRLSSNIFILHLLVMIVFCPLTILLFVLRFNSSFSQFAPYSLFYFSFQNWSRARLLWSNSRLAKHAQLSVSSSSSSSSFSDWLLCSRWNSICVCDHPLPLSLSFPSFLLTLKGCDHLLILNSFVLCSSIGWRLQKLVSPSAVFVVVVVVFFPPMLF